MLERDLPKLYPGSKYGYRMPIGLMEIIDNFERSFLQQYYEKWYRPDNQAIIVVGDVDVDKIEQKIKMWIRLSRRSKTCSLPSSCLKTVRW